MFCLLNYLFSEFRDGFIIFNPEIWCLDTGCVRWIDFVSFLVTCLIWMSFQGALFIVDCDLKLYSL